MLLTLYPWAIGLIRAPEFENMAQYFPVAPAYGSPVPHL